LAVDIRQLDPGLHRPRRKLDDVLVYGDRALEEPLLDVEVHRGLIDLSGLVVLSEANMHLGHAQPGAGVLRIFLDGVLELRQGLFEAAPL
jgi:hypothetical protein